MGEFSMSERMFVGAPNQNPATSTSGNSAQRAPRMAARMGNNRGFHVAANVAATTACPSGDAIASPYRVGNDSCRSRQPIERQNERVAGSPFRSRCFTQVEVAESYSVGWMPVLD